ncbi:hypothetical protein S40288_09175 [Stachybotrys chartarum IBT 40288]|nr:hypothetical protein S40288_09175 [Stachybotrys chartarum IBT 40288]
MSSSSIPAYYELSWAILSTIGLANVFFGATVAGIAGFPRVALVPIIVSAACAIANGMCYYAFYTDYPIVNTAVASAFADLTWLIQEAGLSFYSYVILNKVLQRTSRIAFLSIFWTLIAAVSCIRFTILVIRVRYVLDGSRDAAALAIITSLHIGYFTTIALIECISAFFLLRKFHWARFSALNVSLFSYLMRSTEIRLAILALIGVTRAVTYSFQTTAQSATTVASQLDRFAYTLECLFPVMMFIDILAARLVFAHNSNTGSYRNNGPRSNTNQAPRADGGDHELYAMRSDDKNMQKTLERKNSDISSSELLSNGAMPSSGVVSIEGASGGPYSPNQGNEGISKTVEFRMYETRDA